MDAPTGDHRPGPWLRIGTPHIDYLRHGSAEGWPISPAWFHVCIDADLRLGEGDVVLYEEPSISVGALAVHLTRRLGDGAEPDDDVELDDQMNWHLVGPVRITRADGGWTAGSCFVTATTAAYPWSRMREAIEAFIADARTVAVASIVAAGWPHDEAVAACDRAFAQG